MAPSSSPATSLTRLSLLALFSLAFLTTAVTPVSAKRTPATRHYHSHRYYVLELDLDQLSLSSAPSSSAAPASEVPAVEELAALLGAEHVEQVGELKGHYLVRAEKDDVERGEEQWATTTTSGGGKKVKRAQGVEEGKRDAVMERYALVRRGLHPTSSLSSSSTLVKRDSPHHLLSHARRSILSLEPQVPRLRVKRDLPVLPPSPNLLSRLSRRAFLPSLEARQSSSGKVGATGAAPGLVELMREKFSFLDPLWSKQWHLVNEVMQENSINVTGVWDQGIIGTGVNVAIVDDGLDMHSDDLAANFHADGSWDYNDNTPLPEPRLSDDQHGTRCAGEIAAVKNDVCGVGVAHGSGIAGIRILSASISDADEASSLNYGYQTNDIYSCSWGPPDDGRSMEAPGRLIVKAMLNGVQNGRQGKGSIFVFASGNGGAVDDQCNFDGYTNSLMSITVGAIDRKGLHPFYSEACSANMVVTFSSGSGDNIHTTDVGKNTCTDRHGGTSAAAPIAAGIFALVLEVRPDLTWRDMQHLCVQTAVKINPNDPDWQMTASGRPYNHKYGFGKLDAWAIVDLAKRWELVNPQAWWTSPMATPVLSPQAKANNLGARITNEGSTASIEVTRAELDQHNFDKLEHVTITVFIKHERRGNVEVELVSPKGMKSILARPRRFDENADGVWGWVFMSVKHWDEDPVGTWTLRVRDRQTNGKTGTFHRFSMQLWGSSVDASIAKPYVLPFVYGEDAEEEPEPIADVTTTASVEQATTTDALAPTKTYVKPTAHLPDDHAEASGEAHSSFADGYHPTTTSAASAMESANPGKELADAEAEDDYDLPLSATPAVSASSTPSSSDSLYDQTPGYLAGMSSLIGSTTWLFVALGTIIVFLAGVGAFFLLRRRQLRKSGGGSGGRGGYEFAPATDFEDYDEEEDEEFLPMRAMERGSRGGVRLGGAEGDRQGGNGRTRELFNAFALDSDAEDDEDEEEDEGGRTEDPGPRKSIQRKRASIEMNEGLFKDTEDDLDDPSSPLVPTPSASTSAATAAGPSLLDDEEEHSQQERERRAREEFSD